MEGDERLQLTELIAGLEVKELLGDVNIEITDITYDSRKVTPGSLFICIRGSHVDGHDFLDEAFDKGAVAALVSESREIKDQRTLIHVNDTNQAMTQIAPAFFGYPAKRLKIIGVVGTNGKTTSTYMIKAILDAAGKKTGLVGTVQNIAGKRVLQSINTTPDVLELQRILGVMVDEGMEYVVMEVSSHAIALDRISGLSFCAGLFTNITQDHLDFHKSFEAYLQVKTSFFQCLAQDAFAVINRDDQHAQFFFNATKARCTSYGFKPGADITAQNAEFTSETTVADVICPQGKAQVKLRMSGEFNLMNALGSLGIGLALGTQFSTAIQALESLPGVPGRFQRVPGHGDFGVIVDYAHTPDGLENILSAAKVLKPRGLTVVFGCGGDRDRTKRPIMGKIAEKYADMIVLTSDNPRSEPPEQIIDQIEAALSTTTRYERICDRRDAIRRAISLAKAGELVVIAGKGHETYQIFADRTIHFDDLEVAAEALEDKYHGRL
jgi:UDP-N-acetylmuramoyl-L-alanyl-D-glutamate--2,6-diaminopimelate ligase